MKSILMSTAIILFVSAGASFAYRAYLALIQPAPLARPVAFGKSTQAVPVVTAEVVT